MSGTEKTHPLRKNDVHDVKGSPVYKAPTIVVVHAVITNRTTLSIQRLLPIVLLLPIQFPCVMLRGKCTSRSRRSEGCQRFTGFRPVESSPESGANGLAH